MSDLAGKALSENVFTDIYEFDGQRYKVKALTRKERDDINDAIEEGADLEDYHFSDLAIVKSVFDPDTDEKVFSLAHLDQIASAPLGGTIAKLEKCITHANGWYVKDEELEDQKKDSQNESEKRETNDSDDKSDD